MDLLGIGISVRGFRYGEASGRKELEWLCLAFGAWSRLLDDKVRMCSTGTFLENSQTDALSCFYKKCFVRFVCCLSPGESLSSGIAQHSQYALLRGIQDEAGEQVSRPQSVTVVRPIIKV